MHSIKQISTCRTCGCVSRQLRAHSPGNPIRHLLRPERGKAKSSRRDRMGHNLSRTRSGAVAGGRELYKPQRQDTYRLRRHEPDAQRTWRGQRGIRDRQDEDLR